MMPSRKEPNQWPVRLHADVGTKEPFVARIMGLVDLVDATNCPDKAAIKEAITAMLMDCLIPAFISLRELRRISAEVSVPGLTKVKEYDSMYRNLWAAYRNRMKTIGSFIGSDVEFIF